MRKPHLLAHSLLSALLLATGAALPMLSQAGVAVDIEVAPPVAVVEAPPPPPQPGYVWAPGYWNWDGGRHVWVRGYWMPPRPGHVWEADRWDRRGGRYHYEPGHWR
jgi:hypothetical protein